MPNLNSLVNTLKASGEISRLRLLALLAGGELSVKDVTEILGQSQPRVSRHLKLLSDAGLITRHAEGAWAYFSITQDGLAGELARHIVAQLDEDDPQITEDRVRLEKVRHMQRTHAAAYFSEVASSWDLLRGLHVPEEAVEAAIVRLVGERKADLLLDLGTGTGRMLELLADQYHQGLGIDSSREMIGFARAKLAAAKVNHAQVRLGDITALEGNVHRADRIMLHQVLHYFDDPGQVLSAARRVLAPGGEIVVVDFAPHKLEFLRNEHAHRRLGLSEGQMEGWARAADLTVTEFKDFPGDNGVESLTVCLWLLEDADVANKSGRL